MARPFIEFIQSQNLPWAPIAHERAGADFKTLSQDDESGATTRLMRLPPGWVAPRAHWRDAEEEIFVLSGEIVVDGQRFTRHHYAAWPAGRVIDAFEAGPYGAVLIACVNGAGRLRDDVAAAPVFDADAAVDHRDPFAMRWDNLGMDPNISHLNAFRKNLRLAPNNAGRTYLLAGLPQGFPQSGGEPLERHPHVEEMFMVSGDMPCSLGVMRAGAYFWRPPGIWHGADCTVNGFLLFMRTPGANKTISEWDDKHHPVRFDPPYTPRVPEALRAYAGETTDTLKY